MLNLLLLDTVEVAVLATTTVSLGHNIHALGVIPATPTA
jgi:hypothetical protein